MKRFFLLFTVMFVLALPSVVPDFEEQIYKGWMYSGQEKVINNQTYLVMYTRSSNTSVFYLPGGTIAALNPERVNCTVSGIYKVCQSDQKFEKWGQEVPSDITSTDLNVSLYVNITRTKAGLEVSEVYEPDAFFKGLSIKKTVLIERVSSIPVFSINYIEEYHPGFSLSAIEGCYVDNNKIRWDGDLNSSRTHTCTYRIIPIDEGKMGWSRSVSYSVLGTSQSINEDKVFDVKNKPFVISLSAKNDTVGGVQNITFVLEAKEDIYLKSISVRIPDSMQVQRYNASLLEEQGTYVLPSAAVSKGKKMIFDFEILGTVVGKHNVYAGAETTYLGAALKDSIEKEVYFFAIPFEVKKILRENITVIRIENPNDVDYKDLSLISGNWTSQLSLLPAKSYKEFIVDDGVSKDLIIEYTNSFGQKLNETHMMKEEAEETVSSVGAEKDEKSFELDEKYLYIALGVFGLAIILGIINMFMHGKKKTNIDKEIEMLRKMEKEEKKDE